MEKLSDNPLPEPSVDTSEIDESMLEMSEFVAQMADVEGYVYDLDMPMAKQLEKVVICLFLYKLTYK